MFNAISVGSTVNAFQFAAGAAVGEAPGLPAAAASPPSGIATCPLIPDTFTRNPIFAPRRSSVSGFAPFFGSGTLSLSSVISTLGACVA